MVVVVVFPCNADMYDGVSKSFQTCRLERELQTVQLSATRCSCITILWVSLVSFVVIGLVRKLLNTHSLVWGQLRIRAALRPPPPPYSLDSRPGGPRAGLDAVSKREKNLITAITWNRTAVVPPVA
jgi:hypothetical protein